VCSLREEDLVQACRNLYQVSQEAELVAPAAAASAARSYGTQWEEVETRLPQRQQQSSWPAVLRTAAELDAARTTQESLSSQFILESKRKVLLEAELAAPAEAKRALASLRLLATTESGHGDGGLLN